jgi:osmotically-inducible protein OsmY
VRDVLAPSADVEWDRGDAVIRGSGVRVSAEGGAVRLMGVVRNGAALQGVEAAAKAVPGVRSVENRLITGGMLDFD